MFSSDFSEIVQNTFFLEHLRWLLLEQLTADVKWNNKMINPQMAIICSKLTIEKLKQCIKYVQS